MAQVKPLAPPRKRKALMPGIRLSLSIFWHEYRGILIICAMDMLLRVAMPYLGILLPKVVIDLIGAHASPTQFALTVGGFVLLMAAVHYLKGFAGEITDDAIGTISIGSMLTRLLRKTMRMDYEQMEDPSFKAVSDKADKAGYSNHAPAMNIPRMLVELLSNSIGFLLYTGVIVAIHPLILPLLLLTAAVNWLMLSRARKYMEKTRGARSKLGKKLTAAHDTLRSPEAAKDIRLYGAAGWLIGLCHRQFESYIAAERGVLTRNMHAQLADSLIILLRDGAAYAFLIWLVLAGRLSLGDFVYIFAAVGALAGWVSGVLTAAGDLRKATIEMCDIGDELEYPDRMNTGKGIALPAGNALPPSIELRNVGYTYPKAEKPALKGISVTISAGERIAIVGANGAGKTTLVKLICGLYLPTEGEVLLGGHPARAYNRDEYYTLFSVVFQDIYLLSASIADNISQQTPDRTDRGKVLRCLERTGLAEKVNSMPQGADSLLVRSVNADAEELSGGEKQKLAMARALYKDAPVVILDEPTAALDPLAENEVYRQYATLTAGKTSVYISHRLASTRFCDRILLLDGNGIAEEGTHAELMALGGIYAHMFGVQASYYKAGKEFEWESVKAVNE